MTSRDKMNKWIEIILGVIIGIFGGLAAASIINYLCRPIYPVCKKKIPYEISSCPSCKTALRWEYC